MASDQDKGPLPNYDNPPVVETVLGVQFDRLAGLKNAHLGLFWKALGASQWPTIADAPPLPAQLEQFGQAAGWARRIALQLTQEPASRVQIKNSDGNRMVQAQNDRLHFNWLRKEGEPYPRYETVREGFVAVLELFRQFVAAERLGDFRPNQWEVTYVNRIPRGSVWTTTKDWRFFRPLAAAPTLEGIIEAESFGGEWHFLIPQQRGRLHIEWQHEKEDREELIRLMLTARGPIVPREGIQPIMDGVDLGRETIVRSFKDLMSDEANRFWRLK